MATRAVSPESASAAQSACVRPSGFLATRDALIAILSAYLVFMTHKVAGPLYKVSMYFDRMADGRLGNVTALRKGDMLQDFFGNFREMHEAVRKRMQTDVITMEGAANGLRNKAASDPKLAEALDALDRHVTQRKKQLL